MHGQAKAVTAAIKTVATNAAAKGDFRTSVFRRLDISTRDFIFGSCMKVVAGSIGPKIFAPGKFEIFCRFFLDGTLNQPVDRSLNYGELTKQAMDYSA